MLSGIHWGFWNVSSTEKGRLLYSLDICVVLSNCLCSLSLCYDLTSKECGFSILLICWSSFLGRPVFQSFKPWLEHHQALGSFVSALLIGVSHLPPQRTWPFPFKASTVLLQPTESYLRAGGLCCISCAKHMADTQQMSVKWRGESFMEIIPRQEDEYDNTQSFFSLQGLSCLADFVICNYWLILYQVCSNVCS